MYFRRNKSLTENVTKIAEALNDEQKQQVLKLVQSYEDATFESSDEKRQFDFDAIDTAINDFSFKEKETAERLANNHNTLQQTFMRLCLNFILKMSEKPYTDARNEASVMYAKQIIDTIGKDFYLPTI